MTLPVLSFSRNKTCGLCPLSANATNVCIPTSLLANPPGAEKVILVVGAKPGPEEEQLTTACARSGFAGRYFHGVYRKYVDQKLLRAGTSVAWAVTNAVRCMPPKDANVTAAQVKHCHGYLVDDIQKLQAQFKEVIVLCCGEPAARSMFGTGLFAAMRKQGTEVSNEDYRVRVFSTANPFVLHVDPATIHYIEDHLQMLVDYVVHGKIPMTWTMPDDSDDVVMIPGTPVAVDTETYGAVEGFPVQTVFNPVKMMAIDGIEERNIVTTASAAWLSPDGMGLRKWVLPEEEANFYSFMERLLLAGHPLLGMNLPYDIKAMRTLGDRWVRLLQQTRGWKLMDVSVGNFWNSDIRPERSLKDIAPLLRIVSYDKTIPGWKDLSKGERYASKWEAALLHYCGLDAAATLEAYLRLRDKTIERNPGTKRFGPRAETFYSDVLWTVVNMDSAGVAFSRPRLENLERILTNKMRVLFDYVPTHFEGTTKIKKMKRKAGIFLKEVPCKAALGGDNSKAWITKVFREAAMACDLMGDPNFEKTKESGHTEPATHKVNMNMLLGKLPIGHPARKPLHIIRMYRRAEKLLGTYVTPLLHDPACGLIGSMAYPSWYSVPSYPKDGEGSMGGTQQGRFAAKDPAMQTLPKAIKACMDSRFEDGVLLEFDISQAEPRVGALLSGDPVMMAEFEEDARLRREGKGTFDLHTAMAKLVFGDDVVNKPKKEFDRLRKIGKILRLLVAYKGGPRTFQESLRRDHQMELSLDLCRGYVAAFDRKYKVYRAWQDRLIQDVSRRGYMELDISADTRTFIKGKRATEVYVATICNFPVQDHSASILKDAQKEIQLEFWRLGMQSIVDLNCHDAIYVDCPASEENAVRDIVHRILPCPPYYKELQSLLGRCVPLQYEVTVLTRRAK